ncbi:Omega-6 fatty acid desaturase, endoplasmic reticulum [Tetrabaena socialis]|uniref:Omega-6 fatty acid desaturase, endoplasmic reticulum n=1 Tax=Tetrabaena socialis TaxID=47790 RepID=A0A2J8A8N8_9CHLO|nr:Omega-6 fatty acid desaturase, endoplasmic reticulum [Tetrabaena socialis]|eukprot:PNH08865.1 Omega-6 fatty acid desaturase, endoplasmic reticulum [Tetrabaena socialis]
MGGGWTAQHTLQRTMWLANGLLWPSYWFWQGAVATGVWVIAHECGHGAFSNSEALNDAVGLFFHSLLLVPYYSWKHSHRRHHQHTGSAELDEVFVPPVQPAGTKQPWYQHNPVYRIGHILFQQVLGWPLYLLFNVSGHSYKSWANHFNPYSPIFTKRERIEVLISDLALVAVAAGLALLGRSFGFVWLLKTYLIPYIVVNHWLVRRGWRLALMIAFLQHTHHASHSPHLLSFVARNHQLQLPTSRNSVPTAARTQVLGSYYAEDRRNVFQALWQEVGTCAHVAPDVDGPEDVYWFQSQ